MQLHLVDSSLAVATSLRGAFCDFSEVTVAHGDLFALARNTIVSPANSAGFMDGGIDAAIRTFFGAGIEASVRHAIGLRPEGYLPVGASLIVPTGHERIPYLIVAPTMLTPEQIGSDNCYRAMRAVLRIAESQPAVSRAVYCPGLGTGVGQVLPDQAAKAMADAYHDWKGDKK